MKYIASVAAICFVINNLQAMEPSPNDNNINQQMSSNVQNITSGTRQHIRSPQRTGMSESYLTTILPRTLPSLTSPYAATVLANMLATSFNESNTTVGTNSMHRTRHHGIGHHIDHRFDHRFIFIQPKIVEKSDLPLIANHQNSHELLQDFILSPKDYDESLIVDNINIPHKREKYSFQNKDCSTSHKLCFSADGQMACTSLDKSDSCPIFLGNRSNGMLETLDNNTSMCDKLMFNKDGSLLCIRRSGSNIDVFYTQSKKLVCSLKGKLKFATHVFDTSPTSAYRLAACEYGNSVIRIWDLSLNTWATIIHYPNHYSIDTLKYGSSGNTIASSITDPTHKKQFIRLYDIRSKNSTIVDQYKNFSYAFGKFALSSDERLLAIDDEKQICINDLRMNRTFKYNGIPIADRWKSIFFVGTKLFGYGIFHDKKRLIVHDVIKSQTECNILPDYSCGTWHKWTQEFSLKTCEEYLIYDLSSCNNKFTKHDDKNGKAIILAMLETQVLDITRSLHNKNDTNIINQINANEKKLRNNINNMSNDEVNDILQQNGLTFLQQTQENLLENLPSCPICLEVYNDIIKYWGQAGSQITTPCKHTFCSKCYDKLNTKCPLCRQPI